MPAPLPSACPPILQQFPHNAKHNPPLAPSANGGLTRESDFPKCLPPDCFGITVRMPGIRGNRETQGYAPIHKTSVHADHCSGFFQNGLSRAAQIMRCVSSLGIFRSLRVLLKKLSIPNGAGIWESLGLPSPWDSLLSCVYTVQYFFRFVNTFMQF